MSPWRAASTAESLSASDGRVQAPEHEAGQLGVVHDQCFLAWHDDLFLYG
jgi:hypothetical protein